MGEKPPIPPLLLRGCELPCNTTLLRLIQFTTPNGSPIQLDDLQYILRTDRQRRSQWDWRQVCIPRAAYA